MEHFDYNIDLSPQSSSELESKGVEVSNDNPCPLCGKTDWCFHISDLAIVCGRTESPPNDYERRGTAKDGRGIYAKTGSPRPRHPGDRASQIWGKPKTDSPQWQPTGKKDGDEFEQIIEYPYPDPITGEPLGKVVRTQWSDRRAVYGKRGQTKQTKEIRPWHKAKKPHPDSHPELKDWWAEGKGRDSWPLVYRQGEAANAKTVFVVGGEQAVETARSLGLTAICQQGGEARITPLVLFLEDSHPDLVVIWPDYDQAGRTSAKKLQTECKKLDIRAIILHPQSIWPEMPQKGDVHDFVYKSGLTTEEMQQAIEREVVRQVAAFEQKTSAKSDQEIRVRTVLKGENDGFETTPEEGLMYFKIEYDEKTKITTKVRIPVGNHLAARGYANSLDQDNASLVLEFKTQHRQIRSWTMPRRLLGGDVSNLLGELAARGYDFCFDMKKELAKYLTELNSKIDKTYTLCDTTGWINGSFVLPNQTIGDQALRYLDIQPLKDCPLEIKGTVESWQQSVGKKVEKNSRLIFAVGVALAAPLMYLLEVESGGFHLIGQTSQGKTTTLNVAVSVVGLKKPSTWNTTVNGLEAVAAAHNHLVLPLDEISQADPRDVGKTAYLLGNGQGKQRMGRDLNGRKSKQWQLLVLSTGEVGLEACFKQAGIVQKGGQEVRLPDIPAVPSGSQLGVFEEIHGAKNAATFVNQLEADCHENRGAIFISYMEKLVAAQADSNWLPAQRRRHRAIVDTLMDGINEAAVGRVARRFALVQLALEIAQGYSVLLFPTEQLAWAVKTMFVDWLNLRGGTGSVEVKQVMERIEATFVKHEFSDRIRDLDNPPVDQDGKPRPVRDLLAYRKAISREETEFWVPPSVFKELTQGANKDQLIAEMKKEGWLICFDPDGKASTVQRVENKPTRVYIFSHFWRATNDTPSPFPTYSKNGVTGVTGVTSSQNVDTEGISAVTPTDTPEKPGCNGCNTIQPDKNSVTPVTPGDFGCNITLDSQNPLPEQLPQSVTPVTPVTPGKGEREGLTVQTEAVPTQMLLDKEGWEDY